MENQQNNTSRYRVGIHKDKVPDWSANWYTDYENEAETIRQLAKQIRIDLEKWLISEVNHGSGLRPQEREVDPKMREKLVRCALQQLLQSKMQ